MKSLFDFFRKGVDIHYVLHNGFWLFFEKTLLIVKGVILIYVFANFVDQDTFGKQQFLLSLFGIFSVFSIPGLTSGIVNAVARGKDGIIRDATRRVFRMSLLGSLGLLLYAGYTQFFLGDSLFALTVLVAAPFFLGYVSMSIVRAYYVGKESFGELARISVLVEFSSLVATLGAIVFSFSIFFIFVASIALPNILYGVFLYKIIKKIPRGAETDHEEISFGKRLSFSYIIMTASGYADRAIVGGFLGFSQLSLLSVAQSIPDQLKSIMASLAALIFPKLSKYVADRSTHRKIWYIFLISTILFIFVFMSYLLLSTPLFKILFPKFGAEAVQLSLIFMMSAVFSPIVFLDTYFRSKRMDTVVNFYTILSSSIAIALLCVLIPIYGILGAALSRVISVFLGWAYVLYKFLKDTN